MTNARKRTGAAKRQAKQRLGKATPADESKVRSGQSATVFLEDDARFRLTTGLSVRVSPSRTSRPSGPS